MRVCVCRLGWSSFLWRGLPSTQINQNAPIYESDVNKATMDYIKRFGYGHEWWNFDENYCERFRLENCDFGLYYGTVPRGLKGFRISDREKLKDESLLIFFISRDPSDMEMKLVGFYGYAKILSTKGFISYFPLSLF